MSQLSGDGQGLVQQFIDIGSGIGSVAFVVTFYKHVGIKVNPII